MTQQAESLRVLLASTAGATVLLPASVIAEVIEYARPEAIPGAPDWLMGQISWNDWKVPVISFATLGGSTDTEKPAERSRILVIKSLSQSTGTPYIGMLINGVPRLGSVSKADFTECAAPAAHPSVFQQLTLNDQIAQIPDLDKLVESIEAFTGDQDS